MYISHCLYLLLSRYCTFQGLITLKKHDDSPVLLIVHVEKQKFPMMKMMSTATHRQLRRYGCFHHFAVHMHYLYLFTFQGFAFSPSVRICGSTTYSCAGASGWYSYFSNYLYCVFMIFFSTADDDVSPPLNALSFDRRSLGQQRRRAREQAELNAQEFGQFPQVTVQSTGKSPSEFALTNPFHSFCSQSIHGYSSADAPPRSFSRRPSSISRARCAA